jgi:hypothetical protein
MGEVEIGGSHQFHFAAEIYQRTIFLSLLKYMLGNHVLEQLLVRWWK